MTIRTDITNAMPQQDIHPTHHNDLAGAVNTLVSQAAVSLKYQGDQDCTANPNYPAANIGDWWKVSVAGKIGGASGAIVEVGDVFWCKTTTGAGTQGSVGASWSLLQGNVANPVSGPVTSTIGNLPTFSGTDGHVLGDSGILATDLAPKFSPTFTGDPKAPTPSVDDNDTSIATTAYVVGQLSASGDGTPTMAGTAARGSSIHIARADHVHPNDTSRALLTESVTTIGNSGSTTTIPDTSSATIHRYTLNANCTFTFPTAAAGKSFFLELRQDATGSRTVIWPGTVKWANASTPTLTVSPAFSDLFSFLCVDGTNWFGFVGGLKFA